MTQAEHKLNNVHRRSGAEFVFAWFDPKTGTTRICASPGLEPFWAVTCSKLPFGTLARTLADYHKMTNMVSSGNEGNPADFEKFSKTITDPLDFRTLERRVRVQLVKNLLELAIPNRSESYPYGTTSHATLLKAYHPAACAYVSFWDSKIDYKKPSAMTDDELETIFKASFKFCGRWDPHLATRHIAQKCMLLGSMKECDTALSHYARLVLACRLLLSVMPGAAAHECLCAPFSCLHFLLHISQFLVL